jgi:hypothetical protein
VGRTKKGRRKRKKGRALFSVIFATTQSLPFKSFYSLLTAHSSQLKYEIIGL